MCGRRMAGLRGDGLHSSWDTVPAQHSADAFPEGLWSSGMGLLSFKQYLGSDIAIPPFRAVSWGPGAGRAPHVCPIYTPVCSLVPPPHFFTG